MTRKISQYSKWGPSRKKGPKSPESLSYKKLGTLKTFKVDAAKMTNAQQIVTYWYEPWTHFRSENMCLYFAGIFTPQINKHAYDGDACF